MKTISKHIIVEIIMVVALLVTLVVAVNNNLLSKSLERRLTVERQETDRLKIKLSASVNSTDSDMTRFEAVIPEWPHEAEDREQLNARIKELEAQLANTSSGTRQSSRNRSFGDTNAPGSRMNRGTAWLEELKEQDPERYQEMMTRREEARERAQEIVAKKAEYLLNRDTSTMSPRERTEYEEMVNLFKESVAIGEKLQSATSGEDRRELMLQLRNATMELEPMLRADRNREFTQIALSLGYNRHESRQFVEYINTVIENTTLQNMGPGGGRQGRNNTNQRRQRQTTQ